MSKTDSAMLTPQPSAYNSNLPCSAAMKVYITTHTTCHRLLMHSALSSPSLPCSIVSNHPRVMSFSPRTTTCTTYFALLTPHPSCVKCRVVQDCHGLSLTSKMSWDIPGQPRMSQLWRQGKVPESQVQDVRDIPGQPRMSQLWRQGKVPESQVQDVLGHPGTSRDVPELEAVLGPRVPGPRCPGRS